MFLRTPYNYDTNEASDASALSCSEPSLAQQSGKEEADINTIVRKFGLTGQLPDNVRMPTYGDFSDVVDYHTAMNAVVTAQRSFDALPADIRTRFNNDPGAFVDFCSDDKNRDEAIKLGLITPAGSFSEPAPNPAPEGGGVAQ